MTEWDVVFASEAKDDLISLYDWIARAAGHRTSLAYIEKIEAQCLSLSSGPYRGTARDDVRPGLRIFGYKRRVTIAFTVEANRVVILRVFYGGRNWEPTLA